MVMEIAGCMEKAEGRNSWVWKLCYSALYCVESGRSKLPRGVGWGLAC